MSPSKRVLGTLVMGAVLGSTAAAQTITVSRNVQVSAAHSKSPVYETQIAVDPLHPQRLLACAFRVTTDIQTVAYLSSDDGDSWQVALEANPQVAGADPICIFGPDGTAYVSGLPDQHAGLYRSHDGGQKWMAPTEAPNVDRIFYAIDGTVGPYRGRIYVFGNGFATQLDGKCIHSLEVYVSTDAGETFHPDATVTPNDNRGVNHIGSAAVLSDGTVGVIVADGDLSGARHLYRFVSSNDGGQKFRSETISQFEFPKNGDNTLGILPSLGVDRTTGPYHDRLYATWVDFRSDRGEIMFAYSRDEGPTWSQARVISDDPTGTLPDNPGDFTPTVAVNRNGVVGVTWYSRREKDIGLGSRLRFTASLDGGATFLPSVAVSEQANKPAPLGAPSSVPGASEPVRWRFIGGDTGGLAADRDGIFHAVWVDNRTGVSQVWTARVTVTGAKLTPH